MIGCGNLSNLIYLIDFGLAKRYRNASTKMHKPYKDGKRLTGTTRYASMNTHMGIEQSRRDDLECMAYTLIFMAKGELPWQGVKADTKKDKHDLILGMKKAVAVEHLCKGMPPEFCLLMHYVRSLKFEDKPDYAMMKKWFVDIFIRSKYNQQGFKFDWLTLDINWDEYLDRDDSEDSEEEQLPEIIEAEPQKSPVAATGEQPDDETPRKEFEIKLIKPCFSKPPIHNNPVPTKSVKTTVKKQRRYTDAMTPQLKKNYLSPPRNPLMKKNTLKKLLNANLQKLSGRNSGQESSDIRTKRENCNFGIFDIPSPNLAINSKIKELKIEFVRKNTIVKSASDFSLHYQSPVIPKTPPEKVQNDDGIFFLRFNLKKMGMCQMK